MLDFALSLALTACEPSATGTTYDVGPEIGQYQELHYVPFEKLQPGDVVRVHPRAEPYRSVVVLSTDNVTLCGIRDEAGNRPVIEAEGAVLRATAGIGRYRATYGLIHVTRRDDQDYFTSFPKGVRIEGLNIHGADANSTSFHNDSSCIRVERGQDIVIRDNEISACGWGLFSRSFNMPSEQIGPMLVEGNYFHDNNQAELDGHQNAYTQNALGTLYQGNRFDSPGGGSNVKDRSAGTVFRYNFVGSAAHFNLDVVEAEEYKESAILNDSYGEDFIYGNLIHAEVHGVALNYGADHVELDNKPYFRNGLLRFFSNTVRYEVAEPQYSARLFNLTTTDEHVIFLNNVVQLEGARVEHPELMGFGETHRHLVQGGTWFFGANVLPVGWERNDRAKDPSRLMSLGADGELGEIGSVGEISVSANPVYSSSWKLRRPFAAGPSDGLPPVEFQYAPLQGNSRDPLTQIKRRVNVTVVGGVE